MAQTVFGFRIGWRRAAELMLASLVAGGVSMPAGALAQVPPVGASAEVRDGGGRLIATAEFREGRGEVLVTILFPQPPALSGTHGLRIHEVGRCDPPDFQTAGNGFNPLGKQHGRQNPNGPQIGDLPNVNFTSGLTSYNTSAPGATLGAGPASLLGPNGTSLIVHAAEDDQQTDPDGNAGARLACGVISRAPGLALSPVAAQPVLPKPVAAASPGPQGAQPALPKPALPRPAVSPAANVSPTPILAVATPPPPLAAQPEPPSRRGGGPGGLTTLLIALVGMSLVGAGWLLRRRARLRG